MNSDYSMFNFYKGEKENPFDQEQQNAAANWWFYESVFEDLFNEGDFSLDRWVVPYASDIDEWKVALSKKPSIDKEQLFRIWLYRLLMEHLPEKYQSESDHFLKLYFDTEVRPLATLQNA
ncbi:hypothetical protein JZU61_04170 [bacterium]|nr:hypothetical protein [bacterium]